MHSKFIRRLLRLDIRRAFTCQMGNSQYLLIMLLKKRNLCRHYVCCNNAFAFANHTVSYTVISMETGLQQHRETLELNVEGTGAGSAS